METFKAHYKANRLQRDIPDIKAGLTHRPPVSHTHPPHSDSPLLPLARSLSITLPLSPSRKSKSAERVWNPCVILRSSAVRWRRRRRRRWKGGDGAPSGNIRRCWSEFCNGETLSVSSDSSGGSNVIFILGAGARSERKEWIDSVILMAVYEGHIIISSAVNWVPSTLMNITIRSCLSEILFFTFTLTHYCM